MKKEKSGPQILARNQRGPHMKARISEVKIFGPLSRPVLAFKNFRDIRFLQPKNRQPSIIRQQKSVQYYFLVFIRLL